MRKLVLLTVMLAVAISLLPGVPVTVDQAVEAAGRWWAYNSGAANPLRVADIQSFKREGHPLIWLIHTENAGFVLVAGDDAAHPILGYDLQSQFNYPIDSPAVSAWIEALLEELWQIRTQKLDNSETRAAWDTLLEGTLPERNQSRSVAPLLTTIWNQGEPYNILCPEDAEGPGGHVWAGCTAVAMAQVMRYWACPLQGTGSHSYYAGSYGVLTANFGQTTYNWNNMPNTCPVGNMDIPLLLYHCGVATDMQYSPNGSGAYLDDAATALTQYFSYAPCTYAQKINYYPSEWSAMLRANLDAGRPIVYEGYSSTSGHAFNVDGYQNNDYFHFNWGWGGDYNGFFYLDNLNPAGHSFNSYHGAILNIQPANPSVQVSGRVVSSENSNCGIADASIILIGDDFYTGNTDNTGHFRFFGVAVNCAFDYFISAPGYQDFFGSFNTTTANLDLGNIPLADLTIISPQNVSVTVSDANDCSIVSWTWSQGTRLNLSSKQKSAPTRAQTGFIIYRMQPSQQNSPDTWNLLSSVPADARSYQDTGWDSLPSGEYIYAVATQYNNVSQSVPAFSPVVQRFTDGRILGNISNLNGEPIEGALLSVSSSAGFGPFQVLSDSSGYYCIPDVHYGSYTITCSHPYYQSNSISITVIANQDLNQDFVLTVMLAPTEVQAALLPGMDGAQDQVLISWQHPECSQSRQLSGFRLWRLNQDDIADPGQWLLLNPEPVDSLSFYDPLWPPSQAADYQYAVVAVYDQENISDFAFSNIIHHTSSQDDPILPAAPMSICAKPNPFKPSTTLEFSLAKAARVRLEIFNCRGQKVRTLANGAFTHGEHQLSWDGKDASGKQLSSGIYLLRFTTGKEHQLLKLVLMK